MAGAQTISSSVISTAGDSQTNSQIRASWTLGEPVTGLMTSSDNQLSNGYHAQLNLEALSITTPDLSASIFIYPNPATEYVMIKNNSGLDSVLTIYSQSGQEILNKHIDIVDTKLSLDNLSAGFYIIQFNSSDQSKINTYKLIKK